MVDKRFLGRAQPIERRQFLRSTTAAVASLALPGVVSSLANCSDGDGASREFISYEGLRDDDLPAHEINLVAEVGDVDLGPLGSYRTWLYNGRFPGPEIRVREGERLRVLLENRLPDETTVHWHGVPLPNPMDGVPNVTQHPVQPGGNFVYEFVAEPSGSYMYHSHVALQLDRGLLGPLVVEERSPRVQYDQEYSVVLDDLLIGEPALQQGRGSMMMGQGATGPEYHAFLINGRPAPDPATFETSTGGRIRLRLMNLASQTTFRVSLAGHRLTVTHTDGRPVKPVQVDALSISMGERYDVLVETNNPGAWNLLAASVNGEGSARAVLRYTDTTAGTPPDRQNAERISGGRLLRLSDLEGVDPEAQNYTSPDKVFDLTLSSRMMSDAWLIDGEAFQDAGALVIHAGERVRVRLTNRSMRAHPMHLHGHFFRVGKALKETVLVPSRMRQVQFDFTANNPGDWLFHCHNLYHMEAGMARLFRYAG